MRDVSEQKKKSAPEAKGATAVRKFHTHSIPLDMEDIARDWEKPVVDAGIAAKASVIVRVGMLDLGAGTGSFRVREMMHRIAYPLGVHVRADVNLTDIEATCTDGRNRITEVVDLPSTGVNTERIWLLEHFADWFSVNLGKGSMYHVDSQLSDGVVKHLDERDASQYSADLAKRLRERAKVEAEAANGSVDEALDLASKTKVLVTSVAKSLDDDNEEAHRLLADSAEVTPVEDKAAEEKAYDDAEVFTGDSNESVESANAANAEAGAEGAAANGATAESPAASSTKRKNRVPKEYAEHFNERSDEEKAKGGITVRQAHERLDLIERRKPLYKPWFSGLASALACAAFVFLLGGGPYDMIGAFVGAGLGHWLRRRLFAHHLNQFFVTFVCVAVAALACTGMLRLIGLFDPIALQHDTGIDYGMTVHRQPFTGSDRNPKNRNTGRSRRIRRQRRAVPTLGSIDDRRGTGPCLAGVRRHNSARFSDRIAAQLPQRIPGHYFRFFLRITSSISSVMLDRSHSGFQPHSSRAQVSSSELGQLSAMAFFTGSTS